MAAEYEFDKTRQAIGTTALSDEERKKMLQKFQEGGGKVLSEKELRLQAAEEEAKKLGNQKSNKRSSFNENDLVGDDRNNRRKGNYFGIDDDSDGNSSVNKQVKKEEKPESSLIQHLMIKLQCHLQGASSFASSRIKNKFFKFLIEDVRTCLIDYQQLSLHILSANSQVGRKVIDDLDNHNPLYIEILEYASEVFRISEFHHIDDLSYNYNTGDVPIAELDGVLRKLANGIYPLSINKSVFIHALKTAISTYESQNSSNTAQVNVVLAMKKRVLKNTHMLFDICFPKLVLLLSKFDKISYKEYTPSFEKAINYTTPVVFGVRKKGDKVKGSNIVVSEEQTTEDTNTEENVKKDEVQEPEAGSLQSTKEYEYGSNLMKALQPKILKAKHDSKNRWGSIIHDRDRTYLTYLYYEEFDQEYAFILMTKQLILQSDIVAGVKVDYTNQLKSIFEDSRHIVKSFEGYCEEVKSCLTLLKTATNYSTGSAGYIERSKLETTAKNKVLGTGMTVRRLIKKYMEDVSQVMGRFITDIQTDKKIVQNPEAVVDLNIDSGTVAKRRLNNKKIKDCILETYCYSIVFLEKLKNEELSGSQVDITVEALTKMYGPELIINTSDVQYA